MRQEKRTASSFLLLSAPAYSSILLPVFCRRAMIAFIILRIINQS